MDEDESIGFGCNPSENTKVGPQETSAIDVNEGGQVTHLGVTRYIMMTLYLVVLQLEIMKTH